MSSRQNRHTLATLARLQQLACKEHHGTLAASCVVTDGRVANELQVEKAHETSSMALNGVFARPQLCIDSLAIAARRLQVVEESLGEARRFTVDARREEDLARANHAQAEHRLRLVEGMERKSRRLHDEKRSRALIEETNAIAIAKGNKA